VWSEELAAFDPFTRREGDPPAGEVRRYLVLDAFTDTPLQGNQLGVFPDAHGLPAATMQRLARELNLSETVFVLAPEREGDARVRIFTPTSELPFAGHPVLGTAVVLGLALERDSVALETGAGLVPVEITRGRGRAPGAFGRMRQPIPSWEPYARAPELLRALGVERSGLPVELYRNGPLHVYVELASEQAVAALAPDMRVVAQLGEICCSCFAGAGGHFKTRMFAPSLGVPEDPATGSAAGPLAVHLSRHGRIAFGEEVQLSQGVEVGRPSVLLARATGSAARIERVEVGGSAVIVAAGSFLVG
jgi:trans-2,3-dihydro-3-hydroxyanthranilate isomerase